MENVHSALMQWL